MCVTTGVVLRGGVHIPLQQQWLDKGVPVWGCTFLCVGVVNCDECMGYERMGNAVDHNLVNRWCRRCWVGRGSRGAGQTSGGFTTVVIVRYRVANSALIKYDDCGWECLITPSTSKDNIATIFFFAVLYLALNVQHCVFTQLCGRSTCELVRTPGRLRRRGLTRTIGCWQNYSKFWLWFSFVFVLVFDPMHYKLQTRFVCQNVLPRVRTRSGVHTLTYKYNYTNVYS